MLLKTESPLGFSFSFDVGFSSVEEPSATMLSKTGSSLCFSFSSELGFSSALISNTKLGSRQQRCWYAELPLYKCSRFSFCSELGFSSLEEPSATMLLKLNRRCVFRSVSTLDSVQLGSRQQRCCRRCVFCSVPSLDSAQLLFPIRSWGAVSNDVVMLNCRCVILNFTFCTRRICTLALTVLHNLCYQRLCRMFRNKFNH